MGQLFQKTLTEKYGLSKSRVPDLDKGFKALHSALCYLDWNNLGIIRDTGLAKLLAEYSEVEELRNPMGE